MINIKVYKNFVFKFDHTRKIDKHPYPQKLIGFWDAEVLSFGATKIGTVML